MHVIDLCMIIYTKYFIQILILLFWIELDILVLTFWC